jgi:hypothetical protein
MDREERPGCWSFERFIEKVAPLSRDEFLAACPWPLLVQETEPAGQRLAETPPSFGTMMISAASIQREGPRFVHIIAKRAANPFTAMITVGRAINNDIVLPHEEISKFHAFFLETASGFLIADAQSTNGTYVRGVRLAPNQPCPLRDEEVPIRLSGVSFTFLSPRRLFERLRRPQVAVA